MMSYTYRVIKHRNGVADTVLKTKSLALARREVMKLHCEESGPYSFMILRELES